MRLADNGAARVSEVAELRNRVTYITEVGNNFKHTFSGLRFFTFRKTL